MSADTQIDPRGPRIGAALPLVLSVAAILVQPGPVGLGIVGVMALAFLPGAIIGPQATLQGLIFKRFIRPRLAAPLHTESFRPPRFAQQVGLTFSVVALVFGLLGLDPGFYVFAGFVTVASFLNFAFDFCLGCEIYLLVKRATTKAA